MARTAITVQTAITPFEAVTAGDLDFTFAAGDVANGNSFQCTGKEILIARNTDGAIAYYITIDSVDDEKGRQEDITEYDLAAGDFIIFTGGMTNSKGWKQSDGKIYVNVENAAIELAVIRLP